MRWTRVMLVLLVISIIMMPIELYAADWCPSTDVAVTVKKVSGSPEYEISVTNNDSRSIASIVVYTYSPGDMVVQNVITPIWWKSEPKIKSDFIGFFWSAYAKAKFLKTDETISGFKIILQEPSEAIKSMKFRVNFDEGDYVTTAGCGDVVFQE